jgi:signal transduction histidine kinase/ActR/RegA family two-component response regulator
MNPTEPENPSSIDSRAFAARVDELNQQIFKATAISWIAWVIIGYAMASAAGWTRVLTWLALTAVTEIQAFAFTLWWKQYGARVDAQRGANWHTWISACSGAAIGSSIFLLWPSDIKHQLLLVATLCGVSAVAVISNGAMRRSSLGLLLPMWLIAFARLFSTGDSLHITVGLLALVFLAIMVNSACEIGQTVTHSIRLRFENLDLVERLSHEKTVAETANRSKTVFLAAASHDMRQPAHALGLFLRALSSHTSAPEIDRVKVAHLLDKSRQALAGFSKLTDSLLDISKLDSGTLDVNRETIEIAALFRQIETEFAGAAIEKNLRFRVRATSTLVISDLAALRRVVENLVDNAIRYTERGGVLLGCRRRGSQVEIFVIDNGIGIPESEQRAIFDEFYQLGNVERDRKRGLGLGLAIVRRLCAILDHKLTLRSVRGKGSYFSVMLPRGTAVTATPNSSDEPIVDTQNSQRTILVVEDDVDVLEAMRQMLLTWNYSVAVARGAEEALAMVNPDQIDALVVDYRLRGRETGDSAARRFRDKIGRDVPAIIVTGDTDPARIIEAKASGFPLLHKPLDPDELKRQLARMFAKIRMP